MRKETEERLRREEEERQERRKRVEAIMSRTRGKGGPANSKGSNGSGDSATTPPEMTTSQPDLLGDIVNKSAQNGDQADEKTNGFHENVTATAMPDVSVVSNADNINSNANNVEENVQLVA